MKHGVTLVTPDNTINPHDGYWVVSAVRITSRVGNVTSGQETSSVPIFHLPGTVSPEAIDETLQKILGSTGFQATATYVSVPGA